MSLTQRICRKLGKTTAVMPSFTSMSHILQWNSDFIAWMASKSSGHFPLISRKIITANKILWNKYVYLFDLEKKLAICGQQKFVLQQTFVERCRLSVLISGVSSHFLESLSDESGANYPFSHEINAPIFMNSNFTHFLWS